MLYATYIQACDALESEIVITVNDKQVSERVRCRPHYHVQSILKYFVHIYNYVLSIYVLLVYILYCVHILTVYVGEVMSRKRCVCLDT